MKIIISMLPVILIVSILTLFNGCHSSMVSIEGEPSCCAAIYKITYLEQHSKTKSDKTKLIDCCRKQDKVNFCEAMSGRDTCKKIKTIKERSECIEKVKNDYNECISLMKSF